MPIINTGTAGRTENAQVAVHLGYASDAGHALIDRKLYLLASWTDEPAHCTDAGVPDSVAFATKPTLRGDVVDAPAPPGFRGAGLPGMKFDGLGQRPDGRPPTGHRIRAERGRPTAAGAITPWSWMTDSAGLRGDVAAL